MRPETIKNMEEAYKHIKPYLDNEKCTEELREMCQCCEAYCGGTHDYDECKDKMCFKFYLAFVYLEWYNSN